MLRSLRHSALMLFGKGLLRVMIIEEWIDANGQVAIAKLSYTEARAWRR